MLTQKETEDKIAVLEETVKSMRKQLNHFNDKFEEQKRKTEMLDRRTSSLIVYGPSQER